MLLQLTVFLQNEKGRLASMCRALADAEINMSALFVADTADYGVARVFCDTPQAAAAILREAGYRANVTRVLGVHVPDVCGGLANLLEFMDAQNVNIEYGFCLSIGEGRAVDVLKVDVPEGQDIEGLLRENGFQPALPEDVYKPDEA